MKRYSVYAVALMMAAGASAQDQPARERSLFSSRAKHECADLSKVSKSYLFGLRSENDGVVESALAHTVRMRLYLPERDLSCFSEVLGQLAVRGRTPAIRYKAYLASLVFDQPRLFAEEQKQEFENAEELFKALSVRLQKSLIGYNDRKYVRPE